MSVTKATQALLARANLALRGAPSLLDKITWDKSVERAFFASGASALPAPTYEIDRSEFSARLAELDRFERTLSVGDALTHLLRRRVRSQRLTLLLGLAVGTPEFGRLSLEAYGGTDSTWLDSDTTNKHLADHLETRLGAPPKSGSAAPLTASDLARWMSERASKRPRGPAFEVALDPTLAAKAIAGKSRLRIRDDARFDRKEARALYLHEVETHILTAQNGALQPHLDFLDMGGALSTRTQEGLAVFSELHGRALTLSRFRRLIDRVFLVHLAERGANFLEVYEYAMSRGRGPRDAYSDVARVFRGAPLSGGAPFTKDACYLSGLALIYDFLRLSVRPGRRIYAEVLVSGRMAIEEIDALISLREDGLLAPPHHRPTWLRRWSDLLSHFAFSSFLTEIDLEEVARTYAHTRVTD